MFIDFLYVIGFSWKPWSAMIPGMQKSRYFTVVQIQVIQSVLLCLIWIAITGIFLPW